MPRIDAIRRDARRLAGLDRVAIADLVRAAIELAIARLRLRSRHARRVIASATAPKETAELDRRQDSIAQRVAFAIPRAAARLPWRADCLVQALAAERWLSRQGIPSALSLGVPRDRSAGFEAHAWLKAGNRIVTGGDVEDFVAFRP
jgi:hypothetical protein